MSKADAILLRIFTGPHAGSEIELGSNASLLGSDEACDIILQDSSVAPRHARLTVHTAPLRLSNASGTPPAPQVYITALEGTVQISTPDPSGQEEDEQATAITAVDTADAAADNAATQHLPPGVPCFLGFTCIAWAMPEQATQTWTQVIRTLEPLLNPGSQHSIDTAEKEAQDALREKAPDAHDAPERLSPVGTTGIDHRPKAVATGLPAYANKVGVFFPPSGFVRHILLRRIPLVLVAVLLAGLSVGVGQKLQNTPPSLEELHARLSDEGFGALEVSRDAKGLRVRGSLRHDADRGRLVRVVQSMHYPVRLDVYMDGDTAHALKAAFSSRGVYPEVKHDEKDAQILHVTGYMKDSTLEDWAFAGAREDLPALPKDEKALKRHILHAEDVDSVLRNALTRAGLHTLSVRYLSGTVEISGDLDIDRRKALEKALQETRRELAIPLVVDTLEKAPDLPVSAGATGTSTRQPSDESPPLPQTRGTSLPPAFSVTSVTMQPLRFITLVNGERVFEGGLLAGGYTLEEINTRQLTLRRNGQITNYPLRGNNDTK